MATQSDIAELAKVDRTSVSKILCGSQLEHFSDEIVKRVKDAAAQLGYKHKNFKNALDIGFLFPRGEDELLDGYTCAERTMAALLGINKIIEGSKHRLQIVNSFRTESSHDFEKIANSADVFVIWAFAWSWTRKFFQMLKEKNKDFVVINRVGDEEYKDSFIIHENDEAYVKNAIDVLTSYGHRKIAGVFLSPAKRNAVKTMKKALEEKGLEYSDSNVYYFQMRDMEACRDAAKKIASGGFTAAFVQSNDMNTLDLVIELGKLGKRVPEDISILGNHKKKSMPSLGLDLSSFETPWYEMGKKAAEFLIAGTSQDISSRRVIQEVLKQKFYKGNTIKRLNK
jgi:DNA-binding LacI/PurR family transcriptional regulator